MSGGDIQYCGDNVNGNDGDTRNDNTVPPCRAIPGSLFADAGGGLAGLGRGHHHDDGRLHGVLQRAFGIPFLPYPSLWTYARIARCVDFRATAHAATCGPLPQQSERVDVFVGCLHGSTTPEQLIHIFGLADVVVYNIRMSADCVGRSATSAYVTVRDRDQALRAMASLHKRVLTDETGLYFAVNDAQVDLLNEHTEMLATHAHMRAQVRPYQTLVVEMRDKKDHFDPRCVDCATDPALRANLSVLNSPEWAAELFRWPQYGEATIPTYASLAPQLLWLYPEKRDCAVASGIAAWARLCDSRRRDPWWQPRSVLCRRHAPLPPNADLRVYRQQPYSSTVQSQTQYEWAPRPSP